MKILEPKNIHPDMITRKEISDYCYEMFKMFMSGNESVAGNINGVQIVMFGVKN